MKKYVLLVVCFLFVFTSCEEAIDVDLNDSEPRLVVEGSFNVSEIGEQTQARVELSLTKPFFNNQDTFVNNAEVIVIDEDGVITELDLFQNGIYNAPLIINPEKEYTLQINYNGELYTATEQFKPVVSLEFVEQDDNGGFDNESIELKAFFTDPAQEENFYLFQGSSDKGFMVDTFNDEFFNGNQIFGFYFVEDLEPGDEVLFSLYGVDEQFYNFMFTLLQQSSDQSDGPFETQPATVRGNIVNQTNPENFPLGYFRISQISTLQYTIE
ncbi:DUF4249 domain-containing protein [Patiriisocius hiemis]|uniref:DUF4249 domain-containing protein n=1 Tax=Patiriisocius hiemis TaxID=3075604 RepID=A0ABU2YBF0_9FLAO|nr:DUF4249 domain-containing protein [Constantimarinum sp. W242]MDT0555191.1 DUF4249 domain-containing protein [Constantimarinum sp. W242]